MRNLLLLIVMMTAGIQVWCAAAVRASAQSISLTSEVANPPLTRAFVEAGGGASSFDTLQLIAALTGADRAAELAKLRKQFGRARMDAFVQQFNFVVHDSVAHMSESGIHLTAAPAPDPHDSKALATSLFQAGLTERGTYSVEQFFNVLFSPGVHGQVMSHVFQKFGAKAESDYHTVLFQLLTDASHAARIQREADMDMAAHPMAMPSAMAMPATPESQDVAHGHDHVMAGHHIPGAPGQAVSPMMMPSTTDLVDSMNQEGSGTSWHPSSTTVFGYMGDGGRDSLMWHGAVFPRFVQTGSSRGGSRLDAPGWFMFMDTHRISDRSQLGLDLMTSGDFLTEAGGGYPIVFQSGESFHGEPLHDRQHPHDLISELAATYSAKLGDRSSAYFYAGYPGEPALGPPAFMHRSIAYDMPDVPLGHHWQDATHITFGVLTLGIANGPLKLEGSTFTGREPDEVRTNFDHMHFDSYSGRLSWNPTGNTALQISSGFIKSMDALEPDIDTHSDVAPEN